MLQKTIMSKNSRLGIDIGGTFTDLIVTDEDGSLESFKSPTTDPEFQRGIENVLGKAEFDQSEVSEVTHGNTVATNTVIERTGVTVGLLYTDGFRDLMDMGRGVRPVESAVDPYYQRPHEENPIVPRYLRRPVKERILEDGTVLFDIEENIGDLEAELDYLVDEGVDAVAVCLMHGYKYPRHERRVKEVVADRHPGVPCFISSDVCPYPREYDRTSTTVLNAYTAPIMTEYLDRYQDALDSHVDMDETAAWYMTNSRGMTTYEEIEPRPVRTFDCGPVAGVMAVQRYGAELGIDNLISFDMGGTTCDVGLIQDGEPLMAQENEIEHDIISALPTVDVNSIGSGGGSIATVDPAGGLSVGPESAGANPGPACFGRGGDQPTLTDAFATLGILSGDIPLGGELAVDESLARSSLEGLCESVGVDPEGAAEMIYEVASADMAEAIREMTIYRGIDTDDFTMVAYGAGGPVVASNVAAQVDIPEIIVPRFAGVFSAFGLTVSDIVYEAVEPIQSYLGHTSPEELETEYEQLANECIEVLENRDIPADDWSLEFSFDGWYQGQSWDLRATIEDPDDVDDLQSEMQQRFAQRHDELRGFELDDTPIRCLQVRVTGLAERQLSALREVDRSGDANPAGTREMYVDGQWQESPYYREQDVPPGSVLTGPAVIHTDTFTIKVEPDHTCERDRWGNYRIKTTEGDE
jgi:N-methylhydantoinase A